MGIEIKMPRIGTNDDCVTLAQWLVKNGEYINKGQVIAVVETTKEANELEAPETGYIELLAAQGEDIIVGSRLAAIHDNQEDCKPMQVQENLSANIRVYTDKAQQLIRQYKIDVNKFPTGKIIREKDVRKFISQPYSIADIDSNKILILGGGGFCEVILDILRQRGEYEVAGILDRRYPKHTNVMNISIIGSSDLENLRSLYQKGYRKIVNAVGFDGKNHGRKQPYEMIKQIGFECVNVIHNRAIIEPSVKIGEGNLIAAGAIIGSNVRIGSNCIINAGAIISHDCVVSDNCHIASGAVLGGNVMVGENTLVGQGCTIFRSLKIGANVVVHNGVNVVRDIPNGTCVERD